MSDKKHKSKTGKVYINNNDVSYICDECGKSYLHPNKKKHFDSEYHNLAVEYNKSIRLLKRKIEVLKDEKEDLYNRIIEIQKLIRI